MYTIYLVEDEDRLRKLLAQYLEKEGYHVKTFASAEDALSHMEDSVHLWILDIMLPGMDGFELFHKIKQKRGIEIPIIFTSARDSDLDKIIGLELGSDDYLTKPFTPSELILRVKNIMRRIYKETNENDIVYYEEYTINRKKRIIFDENEEIPLTTKEYDLFIYFLNNLNTAINREELLVKIWDEFYYGSDRVVDDTIRRLRKKMPRIQLETIYGYGYRMS